MARDPTDGCTFFHANEYLKASGSFNWSTRIASFKLPGCPATAPTPDFSLSVTPASATVTQGTAGSYTINVTHTDWVDGHVHAQPEPGRDLVALRPDLDQHDARDVHAHDHRFRHRRADTH